MVRELCHPEGKRCWKILKTIHTKTTDRSRHGGVPRSLLLVARMEVESKAEVGVGFSPGSASDTIVPGIKRRENKRVNGNHWIMLKRTKKVASSSKR